jgi:hypothetical protein
MKAVYKFVYLIRKIPMLRLTLRFERPLSPNRPSEILVPGNESWKNPPIDFILQAYVHPSVHM